MSISISDCRRVVGAYYKISRGVMIGRGVKREVSSPRIMAMVLAREFTGASYPRIGFHFGGRDHSTVMHAVARVKKWEREDEDIREVMGQFRIALAHRAILGRAVP